MDLYLLVKIVQQLEDFDLIMVEPELDQNFVINLQILNARLLVLEEVIIQLADSDLITEELV